VTIWAGIDKIVQKSSSLTCTARNMLLRIRKEATNKITIFGGKKHFITDAEENQCNRLARIRYGQICAGHPLLKDTRKSKCPQHE
jgi:16S rRNA U516 pseudouridylate synthase RsuA-like enzyme